LANAYFRNTADFDRGGAQDPSRSRENQQVTITDCDARTGRSHPRLWHHDYLHLRPLAVDLSARIWAATRSGRLRRVLDLGCGSSPYRSFFDGAVDQYVRLDLDRTHAPSVVARAEAIPFADGVFDAVLSTQTLGLVNDPAVVGREICRVTRAGGQVWFTGPAAWPYDSASSEHRFGQPDLPRLFPGLAVTEVVPEGGMLALPFALLNLAAREAVRSAERRLGAPASVLRGPATVLFVFSNLAGRTLERLAESGPLSAFLSYLDRRLPMNFLLVGEKAP
jgi:SAM-dependent methyltransferase